jgi:hypothetical protein
MCFVCNDWHIKLMITRAYRKEEPAPVTEEAPQLKEPAPVEPLAVDAPKEPAPVAAAA